MKANKYIIIVVLVMLLCTTSLYIVTEGQQAMLLRLGRLVIDSGTDRVKILSPGLHFKLPLIESVRLFDTRLQTLDIKSSRIVTKEKKDVIVNYYVKWRIQDLSRYFKATSGDELKAATLLEQQLNTSLRAEFGKRTISALVSAVRDDVMEALRDKAEAQANALGIHVVDVRIIGIELPRNTRTAIYQRMRADMQKIANRHRADGNAAAESVRAEADAQVTILLAKAKSDGETLRAAGDGKAARIYADAFSKNQKFFVFYRSLQAYKYSFNQKDDLFILDQKNSFFDYFKHPLIK